MDIITGDSAQKLSIQDLITKLSTSTTSGLSSTEASNRIKEYGGNEIKEKQQSALVKLLKNFWGPIPWMIEIAAILSIIIGHWTDFYVILFLLLVNTAVNFIQSERAGKAMTALEKSLARTSQVLRDGKWTTINANMLVPGDIIKILIGNIVPADVKLIDGEFLQVDQSALTGESLAVTKKPGDTAYSGSIAKEGEMTAVVYVTGVNTFFGETAKLVAKAKTESHFQKAVIKIGDYLIYLNFALVAVVVITGIIRDERIAEVVQFALVLTVASIPVALPTVLSITMAVGALKLSKQKAIVSKLVAVEEMAGMDILCSDKTGTLTQNKLAVSGMQPLGKFTKDDLLLYGALASQRDNDDPIDSSIFEALPSNDSTDLKNYTVSSFTPFDPVSKKTEADITSEGKKLKISKGAPQVIEKLVNDSSVTTQVEKIVDEAAARGDKTLGVALTDGSGKWQYAGLIFMSDPPRPDSVETIKDAQQMGVDVKMVTGDATAIAVNVAKELNIGPDIIPAKDIRNLSEDKAGSTAAGVDGFSQVFPEDKYNIVDALQKNGNIVGMTGDGVNDAPALKKADAGIAVSGATDAAKSAASIVLTLPGLGVIISAIKESRRIFQRMQSYAIYRISETIDVLFFTVFAILIFDQYPVTAIAIILLSVFNDLPIMSISYDNVLYEKKPVRWDMRKITTIGSFLGFTNVCFTFLIFFLGLHVLKLEFAQVQTLVFTELAVAGNMTIFLSRVRGPFWSLMPGKSLMWSSFISKVFITCVAAFGWLMAPIGWLAAGVWIYAALQMLVTDRMKLIAYSILEKKK